MLTTSFFRHVGLLSFSIYLVHVVIMIKFQGYGFNLKEALFAVVLPTSYIVALVSYVVVEKPFLLLKNKLK